MTLDVRVDRGRCVGSGWCAEAAPRVFSIGDDGTAVATSFEDSEMANVLEAIDNCPVRALAITHDQESDDQP